MAMSETIELLGKDYYTASGSNIPGCLTMKSIPTSSELDFVSSEDFDQTMIDKILPQSIEEDIDFGSLLEVDYQWLLRCLRILNYGPYYTTNVIYCPRCGRQFGEYQVNFTAIECKPLPPKFDNVLKISKDEFLDFNKNVEFHMLTIREALMAYKDTAFQRPNGMVNRKLAKICYMIRKIGDTVETLSPVEAKLEIEKSISSADFIILQDRINELSDYGLRAGGATACPRCGNTDATFIALVDDRFFRPTLGDLRTWKADRNRRKEEDTSRSKTADVRKHS